MTPELDPAAPAGDLGLVIELRPPRLSPVAQAGIGFGVGTTSGFALAPALLGPLPPAFAHLFGIGTWLALAATLLVLAAGLVWRPRSSRRIEILADAMLVPRPSGMGPPQRIPYTDVQAIHPWHFLAMDRTILATQGRFPNSYPRRSFAHAGGPEELVREVRRRVGGLPDGADRLVRLDRRVASARAAATGPVTLTLGLALVLAGVFWLEVRLGAVDSAVRLTELGANVPERVAAGELDRLVTANFLHANALHAWANITSLLMIGALVEPLLGSMRFGVSAASGALAGAAASAWLGHPATPSVGSSTAIYGVVGAWLVMLIRFWRELPGNFLLPRWLWLFVGAMTIAADLTIPRVDHAAHAGGLVGGGVAALVFARGAPLAVLAHRPGRALNGTALALGAAVGAGLVVGSWRAVFP